MQRFLSLSFGFLALLLSGCVFFEVQPGVCTGENTVFKDGLVGNWTMDFGFGTRPVRIFRPTVSDFYHIEVTNPGSDPAINLSRDFRLCELKTGFIYVEQALLPGRTTILPLRLRKGSEPGTAWLFETPDTFRADASELNTVLHDDAGLGATIEIVNTGSVLENFLLSAPYQSSGMLKRELEAVF